MGFLRRGSVSGGQPIAPQPDPSALAHLQEARNWDAMGATEPRKGGAKGEKQLDFSADGPADAAAALAPVAIGKSRVDADDDDYSSEEEDADAEVGVH